MWEFYLIACEMVFRHGSGMVFHMQLTRQVDAVPLTRDYIAEAKKSLPGRKSWDFGERPQCFLTSRRFHALRVRTRRSEIKRDAFHYL